MANTVKAILLNEKKEESLKQGDICIKENSEKEDIIFYIVTMENFIKKDRCQIVSLTDGSSKVVFKNSLKKYKGSLRIN